MCVSALYVGVMPGVDSVKPTSFAPSATSGGGWCGSVSLDAAERILSHLVEMKDLPCRHGVAVDFGGEPPAPESDANGGEDGVDADASDGVEPAPFDWEEKVDPV